MDLEVIFWSHGIEGSSCSIPNFDFVATILWGKFLLSNHPFCYIYACVAVAVVYIFE